MLDRLWAKVRKTSGCWEWTGAVTNKGYGNFYVGGYPGPRIYGSAHRIIYEILVGPVPDDMVMDHLCRNRICVNPDHLEPVTCRENLLRGTGWSARNAAKTTCPSGHPYSGDNLRVVRVGNGLGRQCRACDRQRKRDRTLQVFEERDA